MQFTLILLLNKWTAHLGRKPAIRDVHALKLHGHKSPSVCECIRMSEDKTIRVKH